MEPATISGLIQEPFPRRRCRDTNGSSAEPLEASVVFWAYRGLRGFSKSHTFEFSKPRFSSARRILVNGRETVRFMIVQAGYRTLKMVKDARVDASPLLNWHARSPGAGGPTTAKVDYML
jgi:hypothetical protein